MKTAQLRKPVLVATAALALASLAACGSGGGGTTTNPGSGASTSSGGGGGGKAATIAFLMPDTASTRYDQFDAPLFTAKMKELCPDCKVLYQNAAGDAAKQQQQANSVLTQGATVLVLDPVDSAAAATIVQTAQSQQAVVIAYDRPIPAKQADYYVSFDNEKIGSLIAQSLVDQLKATKATGGILQINGSPTDAAAGLIKKGVHSVTDNSPNKLLAEFDTPEWKPENAQNWTAGEITQFQGKIAGVVAANDGTGGGAIAAFKAAGVKPVPPVTGNDAELAAIQRIITGDQYNTISKPIKTVAEAAATIADQFRKGTKPKGETMLFNTPSQLFTPQVVTQKNVQEVLIGNGKLYQASQVCTSEYAAACTKLGIK